MFRTHLYHLMRVVTVLVAMTHSAACQRASTASDTNVLRIGATAVPHEPMLRQAQAALAEVGITLRLLVMNDYVQPNLQVASGDLDANFFQTAAYFDDFIAQRGLALVSAGSVHTEPFALYSKKHASLASIPRGGKVAVPSDVSNQHRALMLLAQAGLVTLRPGAGQAPHQVAIRDIKDNPLGLRFLPVEAAMMPRMLDDVDVAGINANFALAAQLRPARDGLIVESAELAPYANVVAIRQVDAERPAVQHLMNALRSDAMRNFIESQFDGSVLPTF